MAEEEEKELREESLDFLEDEDFLKHLLGEGIEAQLFERPISETELDYLLKQYAYLIIQDADVEEPSLSDAKVSPGKNGWDIHDHGTALRASPGRFAFRTAAAGEEDGGALPSGTIVWQFVCVAQELVDMAIQRWGSAKIVDGYHGMKLAASVYAKEKGYTLFGFEPDEGEELAMRKILEVRAKRPAAPPTERFPT